MTLVTQQRSTLHAQNLHYQTQNMIWQKSIIPYNEICLQLFQ
jgi:hypothetical protein